MTVTETVLSRKCVAKSVSTKCVTARRSVCFFLQMLIHSVRAESGTGTPYAQKLRAPRPASVERCSAWSLSALSSTSPSRVLARRLRMWMRERTAKARARVVARAFDVCAMLSKYAAGRHT